MRTAAWGVVWSAALALSACSALIDVDPSKLGGADAASSGPGVLDTCDDGCDDAIACTANQCVDNLCVYMPNDGVCRVGERCDVARGCVVAACLNASDCDDGIACTVDQCDPQTGCTHTPDASLCDDGIACTDDGCNGAVSPGEDGCIHTANDTRCSFCFTGSSKCSIDLRGCVGQAPRDCSDGSACTSDVCDDEQARCLNTERDDDGDGVPANLVGGTFCGGGDCDDNDATRFPGAAEVCDGKDNDCDSSIDEGCMQLPDKCETALTVSLDGQGRGMVSGALSAYASNYATTCGQSQGRDAVYAIPISGRSDIVIDSGSSPARVVLAVATTCEATSFSSTCAGSISGGMSTRSRLIVHNYDPDTRGRTLYLLVDGASQKEDEAFSVSIEVTPVAKDTCEQPLDLGDCGTVLGFFDEAVVFGNERGSCQGGAGTGQPEAVFALRGPADGSLVVTAQSAQFFPAVYVRTVCGSSDKDDELGCINSASSMGGGSPQRRVELTAQTTPSGSLFIFVDGGQTGASYALKCVP